MRKASKRGDANKEVLIRHELPTTFADNLTISTRSDGMVMLQFFAMLPNRVSREEARLMVTAAGLKNMLETMCRHTGHYPEKGENTGGPENA
jgi:hypothetical protein